MKQTSEDINFLRELLYKNRQPVPLNGARVCLLLQEGYTSSEIAKTLLLSLQQVQYWEDFWQNNQLEDFLKLHIKGLEGRLHPFLPSDLYAKLWLQTDVDTLEQTFEHLRTLYKILHDHLPQHIRSRAEQNLGATRYEWVQGTLLFTDLAGFTPFMEAYATAGKAGAAAILAILNRYFARMLEILANSGGQMLEFTGDAILAQFPLEDEKGTDAARAIRTGLRMQRAMTEFEDIQSPRGVFSLKMRIGIHKGDYLALDIGTPSRMEHALFGECVHYAKQAEGNSKVGHVCITDETYEQVKNTLDSQIRVEDFGKAGYKLVWDDLEDKALGEYELTPRLTTHRFKAPILFERSLQELITNISNLLADIESLASYLPNPVVDLLVQNTGKRRVPPVFPESTVVFVKLLGISEGLHHAKADDEMLLATYFSRAFAQINAIVDHNGGILKKVTSQLSGSDILIFFGVPRPRMDDATSAVQTASEIRDAVANIEPITLHQHQIRLSCQIGIAKGLVFAAEIGEPRGRREYNIIGDTVNLAARLMGYQGIQDPILATADIYERTKERFAWQDAKQARLKGKQQEIVIYALQESDD